MCLSHLRPITEWKALRTWNPKVDWLRWIPRRGAVRGLQSFPSRPIVRTRRRDIARRQTRLPLPRFLAWCSQAPWDGTMRAYSSADGSLLWTYSSNRPFETINGVKARGGSLGGPGPTVVDGMVYWGSGLCDPGYHSWKCIACVQRPDRFQRGHSLTNDRSLTVRQFQAVNVGSYHSPPFTPEPACSLRFV